MPAPSAGTSYSGKSGILALESTDSGGTVAYHPAISINPSKPTGVNVPLLINNTSSPTSYYQGIVAAGLSVNALMYLGLQNAAFFARAILGQPDTSAAGYWDATIYPNSLGSAAENYFKSKFTGLSISGSEGQPLQLSYALESCDPESTGTALAAPAAGPLNSGQIATFEDLTFTGASNVKAFAMTLQPATAPSGGVAAGTNSKYPKVPAGLLQQNFIGTLSLTQVANPATKLCGGSIEDTLTVDFGTSANNGVAMVMHCIETINRDPLTINERTETHSYRMFSSTSPGMPISIADLT